MCSDPSIAWTIGANGSTPLPMSVTLIRNRIRKGTTKKISNQTKGTPMTRRFPGRRRDHFSIFMASSALLRQNDGISFVPPEEHAIFPGDVDVFEAAAVRLG